MKNLKTLAPVIIIALIVSFVGNQFFSTQGARSEDLLAAVAAGVGDCEIRVGYAPYPPEALLKDPNTGEISGILYETLEQVGKDLGCKISWGEEIDYATMIDGLDAGRYDLVPGIWPNAARGKRADFTIPLYYSAVGAYARANSRLSGLENINKSTVTVVTIDGEMSSFIAKTRFPNAKVLALPQDTQVSQVLLSVTTGKADIAFVETPVAREFLANNPDSIKNIDPEDPVAVFGVTMLLPKGQEGFKSMLNTALEGLINNGTVDALTEKYAKYPDSIYPIAKPYAQPH